MEPLMADTLDHRTLKVLVIDRYTLESINFLNFFDEIFLNS